LGSVFRVNGLDGFADSPDIKNKSNERDDDQEGGKQIITPVSLFIRKYHVFILKNHYSLCPYF
jgi:hypothetical protein